MQIIEKELLAAIRCGRDWKSGNTSVTFSDGTARVYLWGNHIADITQPGRVLVNTDTLRRWPTATTKSRLRALGANIETKRGAVYVDGKPLQ